MLNWIRAPNDCHIFDSLTIPNFILVSMQMSNLPLILYLLNFSQGNVESIKLQKLISKIT